MQSFFQKIFLFNPKPKRIQLNDILEMLKYSVLLLMKHRNKELAIIS